MNKKNNIPRFDDWKVEELVGEGSFGIVYRISKLEMGERYESALKVISVPTKEQFKEAEATIGDDESTLYNYFEDIVKNIVREVNSLYSLSGNSNIVNYQDHKVVRHEEGIGWDILIRMEYLIPLRKYTKEKTLTRWEILQLGVDICNALELCSKKGLIHRDIKDDNIFVNSDGVFKLGDFGIAKELSKSGRAASMRGTPLFMAPEVYRGEKYDAGVDIYSLGLVLYKLFNHSRMPFMPEYPQAIRYNDSQEAMERRVSGDVFPKPAMSGEEIGDVILKACAYEAKERYSEAQDFSYELKKLQDSLPKEYLEEIVTIQSGGSGVKTGNTSAQSTPSGIKDNVIKELGNFESTDSGTLGVFSSSVLGKSNKNKSFTSPDTQTEENPQTQLYEEQPKENQETFGELERTESVLNSSIPREQSVEPNQSISQNIKKEAKTDESENEIPIFIPPLITLSEKPDIVTEDYNTSSIKHKEKKSAKRIVGAAIVAVFCLGAIGVFVLGGTARWEERKNANINNPTPTQQVGQITVQPSENPQESAEPTSVNSQIDTTQTPFPTVDTTKKIYEIKLEINQEGFGSVEGDGEYNEGTKINIRANPGDGYKFARWEDGNTTIQREVEVIETKTYKAIFEPIQYVISYNGNGATQGNVENSTHTYGKEKSLSANDFRRANYKFIGWSNQKNSTTSKFVDKQSIYNLSTKDGDVVVLYAIWLNEDSYTISAVTNHSLYGSVTGGGTFFKNNTAKLSAIPNTGYRFVSWSDGNASPQRNITVSKDLQLIAQFEAIEYTISYNANGGTVSPVSKTISFGETYGALAVPVRTGYIFDGWFTAKNGGNKITGSMVLNVTSNQTIYAQWAPNTYTISFNSNGGSVSQSSKSVTYGGTYGTLPNTSREGHRFDGWFTAASGGSKISSGTNVGITSNQTLFAQWTSHEYTLTFDANGGSVSKNSMSVTYGGSYGTLPIPTRTGHNFNGWYTAASGGKVVSSENNVTITSNQTLYAQWVPYNYTVTYDSNGGNGGPGTQTKLFGINLNISSSIPSRSGFDFSGWGTTSSTYTVSYSPGSVYTNESAITLYAIWRERAVFLNANSTYGTVDKSIGNWISNGETFYSFTFYTGNTIPNNGCIYQYGTVSGTTIFFNNSRINIFTRFGDSSTTRTSGYALKTNTKYTIELRFVASPRGVHLVIKSESGTVLSTENLGYFYGSVINRAGYLGGTTSSGSSYITKNTPSNIYLIRAELRGPVYITQTNTPVNTFIYEAPNSAIGSTSISNGGRTLTWRGVSVQWR